MSPEDIDDELIKEVRRMRQEVEDLVEAYENGDVDREDFVDLLSDYVAGMVLFTEDLEIDVEFINNMRVLDPFNNPVNWDEAWAKFNKESGNE